MPEHLPREDVVHSSCAPDCKCGACCTGLQQIGQDVSEVLDYEPGSFKVIRHIRPKFACTQCHTVSQAPAASRPIDRCMAGAGLIAHVMVSKYADHCPLYRQSQICAREEVKLCGINPHAYLRYVLERIADQPINRIDDLLPWAVAQHRGRSVVEPVPLPLAA